VHDAFYAYDTKYINATGADVVVPAALSEADQQRIGEIAVRAYQALDCAGLARVDVFLTPGGEVVINEINTLPGFTRISMYPKLWAASGLDYTALISRLLDLALQRHAREQALRSSVTD
jgi:D-alanine-D-alanine ligase